MGKGAELSVDDWNRLLQAPLCAYSIVTAGKGTEAAFRRLREELGASDGSFADGTVGRSLAAAAAADLDTLWMAYLASGQDPRDGIRRAMKVLRRLPREEQLAVRAWLLELALRVAEATRMLGEPSLSDPERRAIGELAGQLRVPVPDLHSRA